MLASLVFVWIVSLQALRLNTSAHSLLLSGHQDYCIGHFLHSVNVSESADELVQLLQHPSYPFQALYNEVCRNSIDRTRLEELVILPSYQQRHVLSPGCLKRIKTVIGVDLIQKIKVELAGTDYELPPMDPVVFIEIVKKSFERGTMHHVQCSWLFHLNLTNYERKLKAEVPRFWLFYQPACYYAGSGSIATFTIHSGNLWSQTRALVLNHATFTEAIADLAEFFRWILTVGLIGIKIKKHTPLEIVMLQDVRSKVQEALNNIQNHPIVGLVHVFERPWLPAIRQTLVNLLDVLSIQRTKNRIEFCSTRLLLEILRSGVVAEEERNHWSVSVIELYLSSLSDCSDINGMIDILMMADSSKIWPSDQQSIVSYLMVSDHRQNDLQSQTILPLAKKFLRDTENLQRHFLRYLVRGFSKAYPRQYIPAHLRDLLAEVPLDFRISFLRQYSLGPLAGHQLGRLIKKTSLKLDLRQSPFLIRKIVRAVLVKKGAELYNRTGSTFQLRSITNRRLMKQFAVAIAICIVFDIKLPIRLDMNQLKMILGYEAELVDRLLDRSHPKCHRIFPDLQSRGISTCIQQICEIQHKFRSYIPLYELLFWDDIVTILS